MTRVAGEVNGNTVSGNFTVAMGDTSRSRLRSTSGDLGLAGGSPPDARLDFESISGDVRLDLAGPVGAEFDVSSFNGEIRNCFGPDAGAHQRVRAGPGTALPRGQPARGARAHQDPERRHQRLQQMSRAAVSKAANRGQYGRRAGRGSDGFLRGTEAASRRQGGDRLRRHRLGR